MLSQAGSRPGAVAWLRLGDAVAGVGLLLGQEHASARDFPCVILDSVTCSYTGLLWRIVASGTPVAKRLAVSMHPCILPPPRPFPGIYLDLLTLVQMPFTGNRRRCNCWWPAQLGVAQHADGCKSAHALHGRGCLLPAAWPKVCHRMLKTDFQSRRAKKLS